MNALSVRWRIPLVSIGLTILCATVSACGYNVSLIVTQLSGPDSNDVYRIKGSVTCTQLHPKDQIQVENNVTVTVQYMGAQGGTWPVHYAHHCHRPEGLYIGTRMCTREELAGKGLVGQDTIYSKSLEDKHDGRAFAFEGTLIPPEGATTARIVAKFEHMLNGPPWNWPAYIYFWDTASFTVTRLADLDEDELWEDETDAGGAGPFEDDTSGEDPPLEMPGAPVIAGAGITSMSGFATSGQGARRVRIAVAASDSDSDLQEIRVTHKPAGALKKRSTSSAASLSESFDFTLTSGLNEFVVQARDEQDHSATKSIYVRLP
jgi:hypothetical protein